MPCIDEFAEVLTAADASLKTDRHQGLGGVARTA